MATGSFAFTLTDLTGAPIVGDALIDLEPVSGTPGAGGAPARANVSEGHTRVKVGGIKCRASLGTLYRVRVKTRGYRTFGFFQTITDGDNLSSEMNVRLVADPKHIVDVEAPAFGKVPAAFRRSVEDADMWKLTAEDAPFVGGVGASLYDGLDPMRKACYLNIARKAGHESAAKIGRFVERLHVIRRDRLFASVHADTHDALCRAEQFKSADGSLHEPPPSHDLFASFKTKDSNAILQVTLFRHKTSGALVADIDMDEASGIKHGLEVIRNKVGKQRTNPFLVRELLLLSSHSSELDPNYRFVFA